jgi:hypothetical protein
MAMPGYAAATDFYTALSSGDPYAIARATAPANQAITAASTGAKQNILSNAPAGGEKNLALENVDVSQGAQVGKTASQGYLNSFNALGQLSQQGISASQGASGQAMSGYGAATQGFGQVSEQALQQKGQTLGAYGGLLSTAVSGPNTGKGGASSFGSNVSGGGGGGSSIPIDPGYGSTPQLSGLSGDSAPAVQYGDLGMGGGAMPSFAGL